MDTKREVLNDRDIKRAIEALARKMYNETISNRRAVEALNDACLEIAWDKIPCGYGENKRTDGQRTVMESIVLQLFDDIANDRIILTTK